MTSEALEADDPMIGRPGNEWRIFAKSSRFGGQEERGCGNSAHIYIDHGLWYSTIRAMSC